MSQRMDMLALHRAHRERYGVSTAGVVVAQLTRCQSIMVAAIAAGSLRVKQAQIDRANTQHVNEETTHG